MSYFLNPTKKLKRLNGNSDVYGYPKVAIPKIELYLVYSGSKKIDKKIIRLSEEFYNGEDTDIEAKARVIIYEKGNDAILNQYIRFCQIHDDIRASVKDKKEAVVQIIGRCKAEQILEDFFEEHKEDIMDTMEFLYDQDRITRITNTTIFNQGVAKGMAQGITKGIAQGSEKTAKSMALKMLKEGLSYDIVSRCSGLTLEQIAGLDK